jgi:orotate phosphoribosyltransferase-like protein
LFLISERTKSAMNAKKELGAQFGTAPFGYKAYFEQLNTEKGSTSIRKMKLNANEQQVISLIKKLRTGATLDEVNDDLKNLTSNEQFVTLILDDGSTQIQGITVFAVLKLLILGLAGYNIAEILNDYGILKRGKLWTANAVYKVSNK